LLHQLGWIIFINCIKFSYSISISNTKENNMSSYSRY